MAFEKQFINNELHAVFAVDADELRRALLDYAEGIDSGSVDKIENADSGTLLNLFIQEATTEGAVRDFNDAIGVLVCNHFD